MGTPNRRELLRNLLAGLLQTGGAAVVVLAAGSASAGTPAGNGDETPLPELDPNAPGQQPPNLDERVDQAATTLDEIAPAGTGEEDSWVNGGFRNAGFANGGFRNGGFANGGFRNVGAGGGFGNGAFRNVPGPGGFRNGAFRNW